MLLTYFDNENSGPVVLLIHGTASANQMWERQYKLFTENSFRVIGVDLRGHGNSINPGGPCTTSDHIGDLKETIDHLKIQEPITIVGHSLGAILAVAFAEIYPELVSKLLLVSLPPRIPKILLTYYKWLLGKPVEFLKSKIDIILKLPIKKRYKRVVSTDLNIVREILKDSHSWDLITKVPKIRCPIHFLVGRFDYIALYGMVKKLHKELPNSTLTLFKWASHTCMEDMPREFNKWVISTIIAQPVHS